jgi:hypothetical protein
MTCLRNSSTGALRITGYRTEFVVVPGASAAKPAPAFVVPMNLGERRMGIASPVQRRSHEPRSQAEPEHETERDNLERIGQGYAVGLYVLLK